MFKRFTSRRKLSGLVVNNDENHSNFTNSHSVNHVTVNANVKPAEKTALSAQAVRDTISNVSHHSGNQPGDVEDVTQENAELGYGITSRQLSMLALSGSVGTGLIIGSGQSLHNGKQSFLSLLCKLCRIKAHYLNRWTCINANSVYNSRMDCLGYDYCYGRNGSCVSYEKGVCGLRYTIR
jgi:hypothetical protein